MMAITKASLTGVFRSPSAVIFSFVFPLIFILVFGFIGNSGRVSVRVAFDQTSDTTSIVYKGLKSISALNVIEKDSAELVRDLEKGRIAAILNNNHNKFSNKTDGFFGFFDLYDDAVVAEKLITEVKNWLISKGSETMIGPVNPSTNDPSGLLIEGFDSPGCAIAS